LASLIHFAVVLAEIPVFFVRSLADHCAKSSTHVICRVFSWICLFGPMPFILVSSVFGVAVSDKGGASSGSVALGGCTIGGGSCRTIWYVLGRVE
jgi:hypothetical protein